MIATTDTNNQLGNDYTKRALEILSKIRYATVATVCKDGKPWNSPVAYVHDSQLNIYWFSDKENQHSKNARERGDVFIVIYDSTVPEGSGAGVYVEAKAVELTSSSEILFARQLRKGVDYQGNPGEFLGGATRRVYKAAPQRIWMNDTEVRDGVFLRDYRVELSMERLQGRLGQ